MATVKECYEKFLKMYLDSETLMGLGELSEETIEESINAILGTITPVEERVIRLRNGLDDGTSWTLKNIGEVQGVTGERIRQIETKAIRRLKHPSRRKHLVELLGKKQ